MDKYTEFSAKSGLSPDMNSDIIEDTVGDYLVRYCLDKNYNPNDDGIICEEISDYIGNKL